MASLSAKDFEYRHEGNAVSLINYHMVFVPKRRRPVLVKEIATRLPEIIFDVVVENRWELLALEVMPEHVHILVNIKPTDSAAEVARKLKGRSAKLLRDEFPQLKKLPCMWTPSYFVGSVGNVSTETVRKYIQQQKGL